jgi:meso-butanediol dehydrogenase / (S,S)-butanediol dehydrogenase / diacetyl reductase
VNDFTGKVALVTGTSGIGRASARRLAQGGAKVMGLGIDPKVNAEFDALAKAEGMAITSRECDVSDDAQVAAAVSQCIALHGRLDIIVNAAAVHPYGTVLTIDPATWDRCLAVNVSSIYLTARHGIPQMTSGGAIVNISSVQGFNCQQNVAVYVATKGAIHALTRAMALDHAAQRVRVNSVSPGSVRTPLLALAARTYGGEGVTEEQAFARFGAAHPIGRIGEPEEVAELVAYLSSDRSAFVTGSDFRIDGGLTAAIGVK